MLRFSAPARRAQHRAMSSSILPFYSHPYKGNGVLGLVREEFSKWERRSPLCPHHVQELTRQGIKVHVQPSRKRIFTDKEYKEAGAILKDDLSEASLIVGVKQISASKVMPGKNYMFFSHTIKAQAQNMNLLDTINERKARLFDYECITQGGQDGSPRLVAFGKFAGIAGMIDGLQGLGQKFLADGLSTPFLHVPTAYMYQNLDQARYTIRTVGAEIERMGFSDEISPIVFAFTGNGNVSQGAREIFELLPFEYITAAELPTLKADVAAGKRKKNRIYAVKATAFDMVKHRDGSPLKDKQHYYDNPSEYVPIFHETVLPYTTVLVNGLYWDARYPRLISTEQIRALRSKGNKTLRMVADITCDPHGSVEFLTRCSPIERPFYTFNPERNAETDEVAKDGICMMGVEILPTELARDASEHFGAALMPLLPPILKSKGSETQADFGDLPAELKRACIASHGELQPKWKYINKLRQQTQSSAASSAEDYSTNVLLTGHLFDTGVIVKIFDYLDSIQMKYHVTNLNTKPNNTNHAMPTRLQLRLTGDAAELQAVSERIIAMIGEEEDVDGSAKIQSAPQATSSVKVSSVKNVLLLGAGMVANPVIKLMGARDDVHLTVASDNEALAQGMMSKVKGHRDKSTFLPFNYPADMDKISRRIKDSDLVISLLPATMHVPFAQEAINQKKNMVTASYVSDAMAALDGAAKNNGVTVLNEVGLDPGIDHMLIMKAVDHIHKQGGTVKELVSLCGGLPDPSSADNPLRYKFSWSPKGVLLAAGNGAVHLIDGKVLTVPQGSLLQSAEVSTRFPTMRLEALPNRDSLKYRELYSVPDVSTICRGTLRYEGWANVMNALQLLKLFEQQASKVEYKSWNDLIRAAVKAKGSDEAELRRSVAAYLQDQGVRDVEAAVHAIEWLGMLKKSTPVSSAVPVDALCTLLQDRLQFAEGEKDMVAMFHTVLGDMPDGSQERHTSRLLAFGTPGGDSAMAATVGYTTAVAAELLLQGQVGQKGVIIPTKPEVYSPMLTRLQELGITYTESIERIKK